ncbi:MAG: transposase, partial [Firmicutes bacterium]|nr:transposase [Bacillota bacterium]
MLYAGIDWAHQAHRVCLVDDRGIWAGFTVPNNAEGLAKLKARIAQFEQDPQEVHVVIEATPIAFISQLLEAGFTVYPVNPKTVERARDRFKTAGAKDDRLNARVLADLARTDRAHLRPPSAQQPPDRHSPPAQPGPRKPDPDPHHAHQPAAGRLADLLPRLPRTVRRPGLAHGPGLFAGVSHPAGGSTGLPFPAGRVAASPPP